MSSNIKNINKQISDNIKEVFGTSEMLMEEISIATVIRNELFLANKEWVKGYKTFLREPEEKGGVLKMINGLKNLMTSQNVPNQREQFINFMKKYRKFLQKGLYIIDKELKVDEITDEEFQTILNIFPEFVICLKKETLEKNNFKQILIDTLRVQFENYCKEIEKDTYGKNIKVTRITNIGGVKVYSSPKKNYFAIRNFLVLQNALLSNLEILDEKTIQNPIIYINAFTRQEEIKNLNKEYMIGLRKNINQKIFNILNLNNNSVFFGFIQLPLLKNNLNYIFDLCEQISFANIFQDFVSKINKEHENEGINLSIIHEVSQYMDIDSEDCKWEKINPCAMQNCLFLLKNTRIFNNSPKEQGVLEGFSESDNGITLYAHLIKLKQFPNGLNNGLLRKTIEQTIMEFILNNFKYLNEDQKINEYTWLLDNMTTKEHFETVLISLARDNALQNKELPNNEIEIFFKIYLNNFKKYQHRFDINYALWLNRYEESIIELEDLLQENDNILTLIPNKKLLENKVSYVNNNLRKLNTFLSKINTEEEQRKFFYFMETVNKVLLGTVYARNLISGYKTCNKIFSEKIYKMKDENTSNKIFRDELIKKELETIVMKDNDFTTNAVLADSYLLKTKNKFRGISTIESPLEFENKSEYEIDDTQFKINHLLYAMTYGFIGEAAFEFEEEFSKFIYEQRDRVSFENISSQDILFFIKDWIYKASREGYLNNKIEEQNIQKDLMKEEEKQIEEAIKKKDEIRNVRKKI